MGLDNIPAVYPCRKAGTAVESPSKFDPDTTMIDCDATQAAGGCPWLSASQDRGMPVQGMFGTDCWWRGKSGTWMLEILAEAGYENPHGSTEGFYGDDNILSSEHCRALGGWMAEHVEAFAFEAQRKWGDGAPNVVDEYRYAAWWLVWIADAGDGATAWW